MRLFARLATLETVKRASENGHVQFHRLSEDNVQPDPFEGQSDEHDRLVAAFTALYHLDQRVKEEAQAIFAQHGLADHGFLAYLITGYDPEKDRAKPSTDIA
jgi:hypothetical protein